MLEIWKEVERFDSRYRISNTGRVYSYYLGRDLKSVKDKDGYEKLVFRKEGKTINIRLHRLVAEYFLPNPDNLPAVNHKDENKSNNAADNLEWCTVAYNNAYSKASTWIITTPTGDKEIVYNMAEYCRKCGLDKAALHRVANGKSKAHKGYKVKYLKEE